MAANGDKAQRQRRAELHQLYKSVLETPAGRALFWHLTQMAGVGRTVWEQSARIHWNAGRQDFGLEMLRDARMVDYRLYDLMVREAAQRDLRASELVAGEKPTAGQEESDGD